MYNECTNLISLTIHSSTHWIVDSGVVGMDWDPEDGVLLTFKSHCQFQWLMP